MLIRPFPVLPGLCIFCMDVALAIIILPNTKPLESYGAYRHLD